MRRNWYMALALALLVPGTLQAQTTAGGTVTLNINQVLSIEYTGTNSVTFNPTQADFDAGLIDGATAQLRTKGNTPHEIRVTANASNFSYSGSVVPAPVKPSSDFQWKVGAGSYLGMTTTPNSVGTFPRGVHDTTVDYQLLLNYVNDPAGQYDLAYTYEVVSN